MAVVAGSLALGGGLLAGGCGGADFTALTDFCMALAQADCSQAIVEACYGATDSSIDTDTTLCINARSQISKCDPGGLEYHSQYADACIAAHQQVYAQASLQASDLQAIATACLPVFNNGGEMGHACTADTDCDAGSGLSCVVHGTTGTCQTPLTVMGGETCTDPSSECTTDFFCDTTGHCISDPLKDGMCSDSVPCATGLRCVSMACQAQLQDGSTCMQDTDCVGGFCLTGTGVQGAGVCSSMYTFSITSASCTDFR
jgi:hypothetical protein